MKTLPYGYLILVKQYFEGFLRSRFQQANVKRGIEFRDQAFSNSVKKSELNFKIS